MFEASSDFEKTFQIDSMDAYESLSKTLHQLAVSRVIIFRLNISPVQRFSKMLLLQDEQSRREFVHFLGVMTAEVCKSIKTFLNACSAQLIRVSHLVMICDHFFNSYCNLHLCSKTSLFRFVILVQTSKSGPKKCLLNSIGLGRDMSFKMHQHDILMNIVS